MALEGYRYHSATAAIPDRLGHSLHLAMPGEVLESFVTKTQDRKAALKFLKKTMRRYGRPKTIVTDLLRSYGAAMKEIGAADRQETDRLLKSHSECMQYVC